MAAHTRIRPLTSYSGKVLGSTNIDGIGSTNTSMEYGVQGNQLTISDNHAPEWHNRKQAMRIYSRLYRRYGTSTFSHFYQLLRNQDIGGDFYTTKRTSTMSSRIVNQRDVRNGLQVFNYTGPFFAYDGNVGYKASVWPSSPDSTFFQNDLLVKGTKAIAETIPTVPEFSLATMVGELLADGLPSMIGSIAHRARTFQRGVKSSGEEFLNYQFGWKPLVSDILGLSETVVKFNKLIQQYERDSGRNIARKRLYPAEVTTKSEEIYWVPWPTRNGNSYASFPSSTTVRTISTRRQYWFEAVYSYSLPLMSTSRDKIMLYASEAEKLLGLQVTPEVLWNLAPWSWLSDWFFNVGSLMTNFSALGKDNVVMRRGYMMGHDMTTVTYSNPGVSLYQSLPSGPISQSFTAETKARRRAHPYGFGVTHSQLTAKQAAILAALGISR